MSRTIEVTVLEVPFRDPLISMVDIGREVSCVP